MHTYREQKLRPKPPEPERPWVTILMLALCLWMFYQLQTHGMDWLKANAFMPGKFLLYQAEHKYAQLLSMMFWSTFGQLGWRSLLGNAYFLWVFGSLVELRLGRLRYLFLVLLSIYGSWAVQAYAAGRAIQSLYIGPGLLTCGIIGAYLLFLPEKKINPSGTVGRPVSISRRQSDPDPLDSFGVSPWFVLSLFVVYQTGAHFWPEPALPFDAMPLGVAIAAFMLGFLSCLLLIASSSAGAAGNPCKALAIQRYKQLRSLDMSHAEALAGTARLMSLPAEQVKDWLGKSGIPMPQNPEAKN